jgi:hypothetical protein
MLLFGFTMMSLWLGLVGGLQGAFGHWALVDESSTGVPSRLRQGSTDTICNVLRDLDHHWS